MHIGDKPDKCDNCEQYFVQESDVNEYMLVYSGEKPHICDVCKKSFA